MLNLNNEYMLINGKDSRDFGIYLIDGNIFDFAIRDYESFQIPGRTGDVSFDGGRWNNITVTLKCAAFDNAREKLDAWRAFLLSGMGVKREMEHASSNLGWLRFGYYGSYKIETSIEPDIFRLGMVKSVSSPQMSLENGGGYVEVSFDCSPKKYLKSGIEEMNLISAIVSNPAELINPTYYDAQPLMRVKASVNGGYVVFKNCVKDKYSPYTIYIVSNVKITFSSTDEFYIDCETRDASIENFNHNSDISLTSTVSGEPDFPVLIGKPALPNMESYMEIYTYNMETFKLYPKWWTL